MKYEQKFLNHLYKFCLEHGSWSGAKIWVAVSGGVDSMALLWGISQLKTRLGLKSVKAIFIHHQTRKGQDQEARLVEEFCQKIQVEFRLEKISWEIPTDQSNFEARARQKRYEIYKKVRAKGEWVFLGHHLDDALEWSLLCDWRSGNQLQLGIPLRRGFYFRPFLCVSKNQILKLAKTKKIPYLEDPTNMEVHFKRNLVRQKLLPPIKKAFPALLKRFVQKQNEKLELVKYLKSISSKVIIKNEASVHLLNEYSGHHLKEALHHLVQRGDWGEELKKIQRAQKAGKFGPMSLSQGLKIYLTPKHLIVSNSLIDFNRSVYSNLKAASIQTLFKSYSKKQFQKIFLRILQHTEKENFPFLVWVKEDFNSRMIKGDSAYHFMHSGINAELLSENWRVMPASILITRWIEDKPLSLFVPWSHV